MEYQKIITFLIKQINYHQRIPQEIEQKKAMDQEEHSMYLVKRNLKKTNPESL